MAGGTLRNNTYAVVKDNYVQNIVFLSGTGWEQPSGTSLVQLYENELCNIGDYYFGGSPPTRFQYVAIDTETTFEETLVKPKSRMTSGGTDDGTLYIPGSVVIGTNGLTGSVYYVKFADGTTQSTAAISGTGGNFDAALLYGVSGNIYASNLATGLLHGGLLSINAGNTATFDITAGRGQIHFAGATWNADPSPTLTYISWPSQTGITLSGLTAQDTTWLYFNSSGVLHQQASYYTDDQIENTIILGALIHPSRSYITLARSIPNVAYATDKQYEQFIRSFGPLKLSGHTVQANGVNLSLNRTSGSVFVLGRNYKNDPNNPSVVSDIAKTSCTFYRYYRNGSGGFTTVIDGTAIDPTKYDDETGTLATVPLGKFSVQRMFFYPGTPDVLGVYYGTSTYVSISEAVSNLELENFTENDNSRTNAIFCGYLIVKGNASDLSDPAQAKIIQSGPFRSTTSSGGSVATKLDDLNDVTITSVLDDDMLIYDLATLQWENTPIGHVAVSRFNGLTGEVTGVASFNGSTGAVVFNNYVSSFNGRTGAVQGVSAASAGTGISVSGATGAITITNTGVVSINGTTGTITNVARLHEGNTFSVRQVMNAGITSSNLYVSGGVTFAGTNTAINSTTTTISNNSGLLTITSPLVPSSSTLRLVGSDGDVGSYNSNITPGVGVDGVALTHILPSSSGTLLNSNFNSYVSTYNGKTGAVQGVSAASAGTGISVSGATGAVTITNTGVVSINGATGVITNVARLNEGNTFSVRQIMNAGISAANLYVPAGATFASGTKLVTIDPTIPNITVDNGTSNLLKVLSDGLEYSGSNPVYLTSLSTQMRLFGTSINFYGTGWSYTFPTSNGSDGQFLRTNGSGSLTWANGVTGATGATGSQGIQGPTGATGATGTISGDYVSSVNGFTGAVSITYAAASTITSSNTASTTYPVFALGSGITGLYIDNVTTPLSYVPSTGALTAKSFNTTAVGGQSVVINASSVTVNDTAGANTVSLDTSGIAAGNALTLNSDTGVVLASPAGVQIYDPLSSTYDYTFPATNGSAGQVLTTDGANPATLSWTTPAGGGGGFTYASSAPSSPSVGDRWIDSNTGKEYVYVNDGSSSQWIEPVSSNGLVGVTYTSSIQLLEFGVTGSFVKLGIGTTAPGYPLDVNGTANFRSGISASSANINGNTTITGSLNGAGATFTGAVISDGGYRISSNAINAQTGTTYTLLTADNGKIITMNNGSSSTVTIPSGLPTGYNTTVVQLGLGQVGFTSSGTTINSAEGKLNLAFRYSAANIISYTSNTFVVAGGMTG